jgi:hypothetical protein
MPDEGATHDATWMSLAVSEDIWGDDLVKPVQQTLLKIAGAIGAYEPVKALVPPGTSLGKAPKGVEFIESPADDLWIRDTGPTFVQTDDPTAPLIGVDFNFNGWGEKQEYAQDAKVAEAVCSYADIPRAETSLVLEGGVLEVDGEGTAIITESCVLNDNRNPGWTKEQVEAELERTIGVTKVIWLPGVAGKDITDGHTDFYARFAKPGVVVAGREDDPEQFDYDVTRKHLKILESATDAAGRKLEVHILPGPLEPREDFAAGYINFYLCNSAVIAPEFGDSKADSHAKKTLQQLFPDREVVMLNIDPIAAGGGGIHCATQQQPPPSIS